MMFVSHHFFFTTTESAHMVTIIFVCSRCLWSHLSHIEMTS